MSVDFDSIVVGAGVIGLAIARQLACSGQSVLVLEKASRAGTETSSRNSEVIHAGIYYPTGSHKAQLCVEGRALLYDFCETHGVATRKLGKLIVATKPEEEAKLQSMSVLAKANGVDDLEWLSQADVANIEHEVRCTSALFSPSTGIVDASGFMLALQGDAEAQLAVFAFNTSFQKASKRSEFFVVTATDVIGNLTELTSRTLINCAGHGAHDVAKAIAGYPIEKCPQRYLARGSYCSVSGKNPFKHLVYPVPVSGALGIHATLDLAGTVRFGPNIEWIDIVDYAMPSDLPIKFTTAVQTYWPGVTDRLLTPSYCGIRPKLHSAHESFADFVIQRRDEHGINGLTNLFGIESPGLTASLAIAQLVQPDF
jgi:L-2-hydroxyglutarate oxidase LhgO